MKKDKQGERQDVAHTTELRLVFLSSSEKATGFWIIHSRTINVEWKLKLVRKMGEPE